MDEKTRAAVSILEDATAELEGGDIREAGDMLAEALRVLRRNGDEPDRDKAAVLRRAQYAADEAANIVAMAENDLNNLRGLARRTAEIVGEIEAAQTPGEWAELAHEAAETLRAAQEPY